MSCKTNRIQMGKTQVCQKCHSSGNQQTIPLHNRVLSMLSLCPASGKLEADGTSS